MQKKNTLKAVCLVLILTLFCSLFSVKRAYADYNVGDTVNIHKDISQNIYVHDQNGLHGFQEAPMIMNNSDHVFCIEGTIKMYEGAYTVDNLVGYTLNAEDDLNHSGIPVINTYKITQEDVLYLALIQKYFSSIYTYSDSVPSTYASILAQCCMWRYLLTHCYSTTGFVSDHHYPAAIPFNTYLQIQSGCFQWIDQNKNKYTATGYLLRKDYSQACAFFEVQEAATPVKLQKTTNASAEYQAKHTLVGSEFTVYTDQACTQIAKDSDGNNAIITITNQGNIGNINLPFGTYWIKETKATKGYDLNTSTQKITLSNSTPITLELPNFAAYSNLKINKTGQGGYSVSGTVFTLYDDAACTVPTKNSDGQTVRLTANSYGQTDTVEIPKGVHYIKEVSAPSQYQLKQEAIKVDLTGGSNNTIDIVNQLKPGKGKVKKTY